jgi:hypothetical protein
MDGRPGRPDVHQVLVPSIPTPLTDIGDLDYNGLVHGWASRTPMCAPGLGSKHSNSTCNARDHNGLVHTWASSVHQVLVPSIPTLPVMQGIIMDWCTHGHPGRPCVHQVLVPSIPTLPTNTGDLDHNGLVHGWASWTPMCAPGLGSKHSNSTYQCRGLGP